MAHRRFSATYREFIGIPRGVADSKAYITTPPIWRALFGDMRRQHNGYNNGSISAVLQGTDEHPGLAFYGWAPRSVYKGLSILIERGLIQRTRQGGINFLSKTCSLYAFTDIAVIANKEKGIEGSPPSFAYLRFAPKEPVPRQPKRKPELSARGASTEPPLRTPRKKKLTARGASIRARRAGTHVHAVQNDPPITARGASNNSTSKVAQPCDAVAVSGNSTPKRDLEAIHAPRAHPYKVTKEGGSVGGVDGGKTEDHAGLVDDNVMAAS